MRWEDLVEGRMKFSEIVKQAVVLLRDSGRMTYRTLKREFALDDEALEDLKFELIEGQEVAIDKDGKMLVWVGVTPVPNTEFRVPSFPQPPTPQTPNLELRTSQSPSSYTPAHLAERIRAEQAALEARSGTDGERKTITALFADLKGSTALIEGLDPEEARAIIDPALQLMMDAVHRYEGYVAQALGDGIFALFGAPLAHEDHPQRALYAALRMQEEMRRYADTLRAKGYPPLLMRVGVNTGEVVLRSIRKDDLHADYVPVGHSTNLAARMEQLAAPGSILVTAYTHRLTDGYFAFKDLGQTQIKGVEEPLHVYEVLGAGPLRTRLQVSATRRGLTRFVGRHSELEQLQRALVQAKEGHGQIVGVMGEPGLGKSRLFYELVGAYNHTPLRIHGCLVLEAYSVSHGKASPYLPVIELLKSYFQIQLQDDERIKQEKVTGKVLTLERSLEDTLPYLFALLGIDDQQANLAQMDPQIRRRRTFEALKKLFLRESLNQPVILIFEDLHWIDGETQGLLDVLSESVASAKVLLLVNYRPEYRHEWGQKTYYTQLRLTPFGKEEAEEFLDVLLSESVGARHASPLQSLKQLILDKTEGTPFFMEEIVQELVEQGVLVRDGVETRHVAALPTDLRLPATVQGVLAARIDRLAPEEKALLQQLAVIGREFPVSLVRRVIAQPEEELYRALSVLQRKEFLYEQPAFPEVEYIFKHALTQEVAYNSLLIERRKILHEQTAQAIEQLFHERLEEHYSELAHHYQRSGNVENAIEYLQKAGQQAVQRSANTEAINHLTAALDLLKILPDTPERTRQELRLQIAIGQALIVTQGISAPEVEERFSRARELCQQAGEDAQLFQVLTGLRRFYIGRGKVRISHDLSEQLMKLAQQVDAPMLLVEAHYALGASLFWLGEFPAAQAHLLQGIALYDPEHHPTLVALHGFDSGLNCRNHAALALAFLGYPDQAFRLNQANFALSRELAHPYSQIYTLLNSAGLHQLYRQSEAAQESLHALITLCNEQGGVPMWLGFGTILQGWVLTEQGQREEGITRMYEGFVLYQSAGGELNRPHHLALLAEAYGGVGKSDEGLAVLSEALELSSNTDERFYEAELYRLKGELTLQQSQASPRQVSDKSQTGLKQIQDKSQTSQGKSEVPNAQSPTSKAQSEAEACFHKAIDIAQKQQAKSLELRATVSLARLWQQQDKQSEAHQMLSAIYNWFTEGFDTKDLQEARALLEKLRGDLGEE
jgi:class 3 adenylate cyclase/predicted ATPase